MLSRILACLDAANCDRMGAWTTAANVRYFDYVGSLVPSIVAAQHPAPPLYSDAVTPCHNCVVRCEACRRREK